MARLAKIFIHPVKSFDPQSVDEAVLLPSGALAHDRRFALRDRQGEFFNAKRSPAIHLLRSKFDPATNLLELRDDASGQRHTFDIDSQRCELSRWLSDYFATTLDFVEDPLSGFPDDTDSPGPTVVSTATLAEAGSWFGGLPLDEVRRRFRANLEIDDVEAFWEDRLVTDEGHVVRFQIGEAELWGTNPCQRCPVPTRHPDTGEATYHFAKTFAERRAATLPAWAPASRFDHFYRLSTNTRSAGSQQYTLRVGDELRILGVA
jgi:uncharacterized protein